MIILQLDAGPFCGWVSSTRLGSLTINAGCSDRTTLCEGTYTAGLVNIGFMLNLGHTAAVQAYEYDAGTITIDVDDVDMHETFPAGMAWAGIVASKENFLKRLPAYRKFFRNTRHLALPGSREQLEPLAECVRLCLARRRAPRGAAAVRLERRTDSVIHELLRNRIDLAAHPTPSTHGDKFMMTLVKKSHGLARFCDHQPLHLDDICEATRMRSRTLQKYFKNLYGMGPTKYFRTRRLNGVRSALVSADPSSASVSQVAHQWGFTHMGRFSVSYRRLFAESPSKTLARNARLDRP